jgi:SAM-dependent methyltransferase
MVAGVTTNVLERLVGAAYDRAAPALARVADPVFYRALAKPLVDAVTDALGPDPGPLLDVAAGTGAFGRSFEGAVALDIAAGQLLANPAASRVRADASHLPFRPDTFAAVGCSFGINHVPTPAVAVKEMARVAPFVAISTWARPEPPYEPKRIVQEALERHVGSSRSPLGVALDDLGDRIGSVEAVVDLFEGAGLESLVREEVVEIPWSGTETYLGYRLAMPTTSRVTDIEALHREVAESIADLSPRELSWHAHMVIGVGQRRTGGT